MKDLTKGYPAKVIIFFAIPFLLGSIFQQLYNMADSMIVSTYVGTGALAAVGATSVITNTLISLLNGLTQGFSILIANSFGAKDMVRLRRFVAGTVILTCGTAAFLTVAGFTFIVPILELLNTPTDIMSDAVSYVRVILIGIIFTAIYNMCANMLRAVGDSKTPLYCLLIGVAVNILLDLLFVREFQWGIQGAAFATILSQSLTCLLCGGYMVLQFREIFPEKDEWQLEAGQYGDLITSGLSMGLMVCIVHTGTIVLQGAINDLGTNYVAAHTAARRVLEILMTIINAGAVTMTTYISQNMGAGRVDRVKQGVRQCLVIVTVITTVLIVMCFLFGESVLHWITHTTNPLIIENGVSYIQIGVLFFYVLGPLLVLRCSMQGMGRKVVPVVASVLEMAIKILFASLLVPMFGYMGVVFTEPISWVVMTIWLAVCYYSKSPEKLLEERKTKSCGFVSEKQI